MYFIHALFFVNSYLELVVCPTLSIQYGSLQLTNQSYGGSVANISCDSKYTLDGPSLRICQENGNWTGNETQCQRKLFYQ